MPGCRGCNRGCSSYREKHIISRIFTLLGGGSFDSCENCQCDRYDHY